MKLGAFWKFLADSQLNIFGFTGIFLISFGCYQFSKPVGFIVAGVLLLLLTVIAAFAPQNNKKAENKKQVNDV